MSIVGKTLYDYFTEKLEQNLGQAGRNPESLNTAFKKTNEDMGFDAYCSTESYMAVKRRKFNTRKK
jgi:hypothetical protein